MRASRQGFFFVVSFILALSSAGQLVAKEPTTVVYRSLKPAKPIFLVISEGDLATRKSVEDRIVSKLAEFRALKSYLLIPQTSDSLSQQAIQDIADRLKFEGVNAFVQVSRVALQGSIECSSSSEMQIFGMPDLGVRTSTACQHIDDWIYRITIRDFDRSSIVAVSELKASDQGLFDELATTFGGGLSNQMIDRMLKSLTKNHAFQP